ncbi:hypothetical protein KO02_16675 [Sphingobacterium sp. ML3W]|uniref:hypothetical protein n=1 Tax=Sphingobacterium sp. ML3W TaxID=1538644 RepID=UPI0004F898E4|nr:hypothetical protein [Sphingobacterium sp. ML3W]AIM38128.1 hypothetical protein KO02_16675 [Sphingobacterium sp. ML3W]
MPWYSFTPIGTPDVSNPNHYTLVGSTPPSCPTPNEQLCAIQASDNMSKPILTDSLIAEIGNTVNNKIESTNVLLKP